MKIEKLDTGKLLLLDDSGDVVKGLDSDMDLGYHPHNSNILLMSENIKLDPFTSINIDVMNLSLILGGVETTFTSTVGDLIRELYTNYF